MRIEEKARAEVDDRLVLVLLLADPGRVKRRRKLSSVIYAKISHLFVLGMATNYIDQVVFIIIHSSNILSEHKK